MDVLQEIKKPIDVYLSEYRCVFESFLVNDNSLLNSALKTVASRQGKMMRPILTLLVSNLLSKANSNSIYTAATFEFFHTASLLHDDIVDESDQRRGNPSINSLFGNKVAVLVGDYLLANSLKCAAKTGCTRLVDIVSEAAHRLAGGEILQLQNVGNDIFSEDTYFDIIKGKTAALFAACCEGGALSVNADESDIEKLKLFGEYIGICFQIRDDIFDYNDDPVIGKPTGNDMKEGKLTLPVIYVILNSGDDSVYNLALKVRSGDASDSDIQYLISYTKDNGGISYAQDIMTEYAEKAKSLLNVYPDSDVKQALCSYVDFVVGRKY